MSGTLLDGCPSEAPTHPTGRISFADVAVTATANEFAGIYRNKRYHEPDFDAVLRRAAEAGVEKVMLTGMSLADVPFNLAIAAAHPGQCYITIGVHPYHAAEPEADDSYYERLLNAVQGAMHADPSPLCAFGELGLDYDRVNKASKEQQILAFKTQLDLYVRHKLDLPLFLHCRSSFHDFVTVIKPYLPHLPPRPRRGLVHSFVGTTDQMKAIVEMGFDISVNGFSFKDAESLAMIRALPLSHLQIETDSPWGEIAANSDIYKRYLANARTSDPPSKKKDKFQAGLMVKGRNESCSIINVAFIVAGLRGETVDQIIRAAWDNSTKMFNLTR